MATLTNMNNIANSDIVYSFTHIVNSFISIYNNSIETSNSLNVENLNRLLTITSIMNSFLINPTVLFPLTSQLLTSIQPTKLNYVNFQDIQIQLSQINPKLLDPTLLLFSSIRNHILFSKEEDLHHNNIPCYGIYNAIQNCAYYQSTLGLVDPIINPIILRSKNFVHSYFKQHPSRQFHVCRPFTNIKVTPVTRDYILNSLVQYTNNEPPSIIKAINIHFIKDDYSSPESLIHYSELRPNMTSSESYPMKFSSDTMQYVASFYPTPITVTTDIRLSLFNLLDHLQMTRLVNTAYPELNSTIPIEFIKHLLLESLNCSSTSQKQDSLKFSYSTINFMNICSKYLNIHSYPENSSKYLESLNSFQSKCPLFYNFFNPALSSTQFKSQKIHKDILGIYCPKYLNVHNINRILTLFAYIYEYFQSNQECEMITSNDSSTESLINMYKQFPFINGPSINLFSVCYHYDLTLAVTNNASFYYLCYIAQRYGFEQWVKLNPTFWNIKCNDFSLITFKSSI